MHFGRFEYSAKPPGENFSLPGVFVRLLDATVLSTYPGIWQERRGNGDGHATIGGFNFKQKSKAHLFVHSDGSVYQFIPDFIELGVSILNPVQARGVSLG